jgi:aspartate racemase
MMKKIGLLGGLSWVSTIDYYRHLNEGINERAGGLNFAECIIYSVNFGELQRHGWDDWKRTFELLANGCSKLKAAGADAIVLCANTAHALADELEAHAQLPLIHIATATAQEINRSGLKTVGLLGTKMTMELSFYRDKLRCHGIETITPEDADTRDFIQHTLKHELSRGTLNESTKRAYLAIIQQLVARGAQGIVLACTEIPLLICERDISLALGGQSVPVFDTTLIHARAAVDFALAD